MNDKYCYMRWLEEMWEVHKFDLLGRTEREEQKKDETLEIFRAIVKLSESDIDSPDFSPREDPLW